MKKVQNDTGMMMMTTDLEIESADFVTTTLRHF